MENIEANILKEICFRPFKKRSGFSRKDHIDSASSNFFDHRVSIQVLSMNERLRAELWDHIVGTKPNSAIA